MAIKKHLIEYGLCISISVALLGIYFLLYLVVPFDSAKFFGHFLWWPIESVLNSYEIKKELTLLVFGRMSPNFFPIQLVVYFIIWPTIFFVFIRAYKCAKVHLT